MQNCFPKVVCSSTKGKTVVVALSVKGIDNTAHRVYKSGGLFITQVGSQEARFHASYVLSGVVRCSVSHVSAREPTALIDGPRS